MVTGYPLYKKFDGSKSRYKVLKLRRVFDIGHITLHITFSQRHGAQGKPHYNPSVFQSRRQISEAVGVQVSFDELFNDSLLEASRLEVERSSKTVMYISPAQILVVFLTTFGRQCSVIARSLSQDSSSKDVTSCVIKGERNPHPINSSFITSDCKLQCYCSVSGVVSCMELCPQEPAHCLPGRELHEVEVPVGSGEVRCSCKQQYCVPLKVFCYRPDTNKKRKVGETFTLGNCSKTCRCNENGKISCTPMCPKLKCGKGKLPKRRGFIETRGCSCEIQECVAVPKERFCRVDGRRFRRGRVFITKDCRLKCRCRKNGKARCRPLCKTSPKTTVCNRGKKRFAGGRCSCTQKECKPDIKNYLTDSTVSILESKQ